MDRTSHLRMIRTRRGRATAAAAQARRRGVRECHRFVIGSLIRVDGKITLHCVYCGPAYDVPRPPVFTTDPDRFG